MSADESTPTSGADKETNAAPSPGTSQESTNKDAKPEEAKARVEGAGEAPAEKPKQRRGFAAMDRAKVRAIAMLGGAAVHRKGTAHRFSREEAREAGRKGGLAPHRVRGRKLPAESSEAKPTTEEG